MNADEIFREAHLLSAEDRVRLANLLLESVDPPDPEIEAAWLPVIERRVEDMKSGRMNAIPGDEFLAELKRRFPDL